MPRNRPPTSGYARIAQAEEDEEEEALLYSDNDDPFQNPAVLSKSAVSYAAVQPPGRGRMHMPDRGSTVPKRPSRRRTNSGVDIKAINQRLEHWAEEIKDRFKIKKVHGKTAEDEHLEIYSSVFQAPEDIRPATREVLDNQYDDGAERLSKLEFDDFVESVRTAIELGMHPKLISQGSSGSYFARNSGGKVVGVFKPKDEEPYANKNPKWTKWIHRNLFPFAFGRACLIPNLSYVSEAAAYVLDCQLRTNIVPYTDVVSLSSKSFHYDYWERRAFSRKGKPLPEKPGSFQIFLKGFKGATEFFKENPWPDQYGQTMRDEPTRRKKRNWDNCRPGSSPAAEESEAEDDLSSSRAASRPPTPFWTEALQQSFREQLEKLVILDYIMRNTDRGTDNWMIRIDTEKQEASFVMRPNTSRYQATSKSEEYHRRNENMLTEPATDDTKPDSELKEALPRIGAIDNSLSWPWKHPDAWRSYPFGWLFLPVSLIGRPFSENTRKHFIPLLTSKLWWTETQVRLRQCFEMDADFKERMFARQMAVMKGQAWNVLETLKSADHGPLELTRRSRVLVWDDIVEIPVAVPLARPSAELRRATAVAAAAATTNVEPSPFRLVEEDEEMDIAAVRSSSSRQRQSADLLGLSPTAKPTDNPFNISRHSSSMEAHAQPADAADLSISGPTEPVSLGNLGVARPSNARTQSGVGQVSHNSPRVALQANHFRKRGFSFAGMRQAGFGDEEDGDLGYAVANDLERSRRRVIVERLEMVRSKPPVFTWC